MDDTSNAGVSDLAVRPGTADEGAGITRRTFWEANESVFLGTGFIVLTLFIWQMIPHVLTLSKGTKLFFTTPTQVAATLYSLFASGEIWPALQFSGTACVGFGTIFSTRR